MKKERIVETNQGIQDFHVVEEFDEFQRQMRDRGWIETDEVMDSGIREGHVLEIGSGPGYFGLEWLKKTKDTRLTALEISPEMIQRSQRNAEHYGLSERVAFVHGTALAMPFEEEQFDGVFSSGSLHEWEDPVSVINEIGRVLKSGGRFFIGDLRRDTHPLVKWFMKRGIKSPCMKKGLMTSFQASYTRTEILEILGRSVLQRSVVKSNPFGMSLRGEK